MEEKLVKILNEMAEYLSMGEPFKSVGSITSLFKDNMGTAKQIMEVIAQIKRNSEEIA